MNPLVIPLLELILRHREHRRAQKEAKKREDAVQSTEISTTRNVPMLTLRRVAYRDDCVQGVLLHHNRAIMLTMEDPWRSNEQNVSCIPTGTYTCKPYSSVKFPNVWQLHDVPGRTLILIHAGNSHLDTNGCILVGQQFGQLNGLPAVLSSKKALDELRALASGWTEFDLTVEHGKYGVDGG